MNIANKTFVAHDVLNNPIIFECKEVQGHTDELTQIVQELSKVIVPAYTQIELEFANQMPEAISTDFMLKSLAPLADQGIDKINWNLFEQGLENHLKHFFATMDWKAGSGAQDNHFFVVAKDAATDEYLGAIQFFRTPLFEEGSIKAALFGVLPSAANRGLEKLLMCSIFRILPDIKHIFLHTRSTNVSAIGLYKEWGFTQLVGKLPNWTDLEYRAEQSDTLQKMSNNK